MQSFVYVYLNKMWILSRKNFVKYYKSRWTLYVHKMSMEFNVNVEIAPICSDCQKNIYSKVGLICAFNGFLEIM
jgi:hypothetical protein